MKVLKHNGSQHHGIGILPDIYVSKTILGIKDGRDEFLEKTIEEKEYLEKIESPVKGFYKFDNSAHSPLFEESKKFLEIIIKDVLNQTTILADK